MLKEGQEQYDCTSRVRVMGELTFNKSICGLVGILLYACGIHLLRSGGIVLFN